MRKIYKAEYEDKKYEIIFADSDKEAFFEALCYDDIHSSYFDLYEVNYKHKKIRKISEDGMFD